MKSFVRSVGIVALATAATLIFNTAGAEITGPEAPQELAEAMHKAWVLFVKRGDPGWLPHSSSGLMQFAEQSRFETNDRNFQGSRWAGLL